MPGFAFIRWGAGSSQVSEATKAQGLGVDRLSGGEIKSYDGKLDGTPGRLDFLFEKDSFFQGDFTYFGEADVSQARAVAYSFKEKIRRNGTE